MFKKILSIMLVVVIGGLFLTGCKGNAMLRQKHNREMAMERLDLLAENLNLSSDQQAQFEKLKATAKEKMGDKQKEREEFRNEIMAELQKDKPDINLIAEKAKKKIDDASANAKEGIDLALEFYNMLDENQQSALIDKIQKKVDAIKVLQEE